MERKGPFHTHTHPAPLQHPHLFIHLSSTHQLNPFPLARSGTILAPYLPSVSLSEFLFNLQEMFPLMGLLIWCCASCFYLQELKEVLERRDALRTMFNYADSGSSRWTACLIPGCLEPSGWVLLYVFVSSLPWSLCTFSPECKQTCRCNATCDLCLALLFFFFFFYLLASPKPSVASLKFGMMASQRDSQRFTSVRFSELNQS